MYPQLGRALRKHHSVNDAKIQNLAPGLVGSDAKNLLRLKE